MPTVSKSCVIEKAYYEDGTWDVIASVKIGENTYTAGHRFEGPDNMTDVALKAAVLDLY